MDKFERILSAFKNEPTDKVPYAVWKHFPEFDKTPQGLYEAQMKFQNEYDSDIIKIAIHGRAFVVDFGAELGGYDPNSGSRICIKRPILRIEDWETIEAIDPNNGEYGKQIKAMELIGKETEEIPSMMTIFSPLMIASQMDASIIENFKKNPVLIKEQIAMLTSLLSEFIKGTIEAGANGIFLATQHFNDRLDESTRKELEFKPMENIIASCVKDDIFCVLHLHGDKPDFDLATQLPKISAINWHDQQTYPNLEQARSKFSGALMGGLNTEEWSNLSASKISTKIEGVYKNFKHNGLILSPGCVIPQQIDDKQIKTAINTIKNL